VRVDDIVALVEAAPIDGPVVVAKLLLEQRVGQLAVLHLSLSAIGNRLSAIGYRQQTIVIGYRVCRPWW